MGEKPPGTESARRASGGQETIVRKRRRRRWAVLTAFPAGGGCLAFGLAFTGHSLRRISVQLPHILGESIEIATGVLLMAAAIAVLIVLILVPWCFWTAIRNVGDQDMANRWLDLATRVVYIVTGGWLKGLRRAPAQLCGELVSVEWEPRTASFWELLVPAEQADLVASAVEATFQAGSILCHEGQRADQVFVIRSGRIAVCVESPSGQQVVAIRHAGDIVGERAALQVGERSATITALRAVTAYVVPTEDFSSFLHRHPHVLTIIENQIYGRLTENRLQCAIVEGHCVAGAARPAGSWNGQNCTIVLIDIANFGASTRCDRDRRRIRAGTVPDHAKLVRKSRPAKRLSLRGPWRRNSSGRSAARANELNRKPYPRQPDHSPASAQQHLGSGHPHPDARGARRGSCRVRRSRSRRTSDHSCGQATGRSSPEAPPGRDRSRPRIYYLTLRLPHHHPA